MIFSSSPICLLATLLYLQLPTLPVQTLPDPANFSDIPHIVYLKQDMVEQVEGVLGGESLVEHHGDIVTGTVEGFLVGVDPDTLNVKWKVKCPPSKSGSACRILGLRSVGHALFGLDINGRLFKYQSEQFEWLLESDTAGFYNDLVVHQDVIYLTESYSSRDDSKQTMLQRFYSLEQEGKIISYNFTSGKVSVLAEQLRIPNGIELHHNNRWGDYNYDQFHTLGDELLLHCETSKLTARKQRCPLPYVSLSRGVCRKSSGRVKTEYYLLGAQDYFIHFHNRNFKLDLLHEYGEISGFSFVSPHARTRNQVAV